jgi:hypothetical protein
VHAHRIGHGALVRRGVLRLEVVPEGVERGRLAAEERTGLRLQGCLVEALLPVAKDRLGTPGQGRLQGSPKTDVISGRHQVERPAHRGDADDLPLAEGVEKVAAAKILKASPEPREGRPGQLCLKPDEPRDGVRDRHGFAGEQHLPREQGAVELTDGESARHPGQRGAQRIKAVPMRQRVAPATSHRSGWTRSTRTSQVREVAT